MLLLAVDLALVVIGARRLARAGAPWSAEVRQMLLAVAAAAQVVVVLQIAGFVVRSFAPLTVVALQSICTACIVWRTAPAGRPAWPSWPSARPWRRRAGRRAAVAPAVLGVGLGGALAARGVLALTLPPHGYDPLWYHLPGIAHWLQAGRFGTVEWSEIVGRYPAGSDLLVMYPAVFVRSMHALALGQALAMVVFVLGTRALAHTLGAGRRGAWFAGLLAGASPVAVAQTFTANVDLFVAAWAVVAAVMVAAAARAANDRERGPFLGATVWTGVACGLLAGSKYSAVPAAAAAVVAIWFVARRSAMRPAAWRAAATVVGVALVMGGSWYVQNAIVERNPIAPFRVELFGRVVFDGDGSAEEWLSSPPDNLDDMVKPAQLVAAWADDAKVLVQPRALFEQEPRGGLGPFWVLFGVPSLVAVGLLALRDRVRPAAAVVAPVAVLLTGALGQPYWWWSRFVLPLVPLGAIAFVWLVRRPARERTVRAVELLAVAIAGCGIALGTVRLGYPDGEWSGTVVAAGRLALDARGDVTYADVMASQAWNARVPHDGRVGLDVAIAPVGGFVLLPLFGDDLSHRVTGLREGDPFDELDAVVVLASGPMEQRVDGDARFVRVERSPRGLVAFVRR